MNWYKFAKFHLAKNLGPYINLTKIDSGQNGTVYLDLLTGHAIKHTRSRTEAERAKSLIGKSYIFLPIVYKVIDYKKTWLIERENIESLPEDQIYFLDIVQEALEESNYDFIVFKEQVSITLEAYGYEPEDYYATAILYAQKLMDLIDDIESLPRGKTGDVRGDNIGIRGKDFVVRDLDV